MNKIFGAILDKNVGILISDKINLVSQNKS